MEDPFCPNFNSCQLINGSIPIPTSKKDNYINLFGKNSNSKWQVCKRFVTKKKLSFCPDFVMPDTTLTTEAIVEKFDLI